MRLKFLLVVVLISLSQSSPLLGRHLKKKDETRANKEVRSIVSAIVDAILDGDRKRRSEVVDYTEDDDGSLPKTMASEQKSKYENENGIQKRNVRERTFEKREDRDIDEGLRLADVIATSDVNSTDKESETLKRNTIEHDANVTNSESQDKDPKIDDDSEREDGVRSGAADEEKLSGSSSNFSDGKSEIARVRLESGRLTGLSDGTKKDAQPTESGNESGDDSDDDDDDDDDNDADHNDDDDKPEMELDNDRMTVSGSNRDDSADMDTESGSDDHDSENATSSDAMEERALDNDKNTGEENYRKNFSEIVAVHDENTSQKMNKDHVSKWNRIKKWKWNKEDGDKDTSASKVPLKSFVSGKKQNNQSELDENSILESNQVSENFPGDIDKQVNDYNNTSVVDDGQESTSEITRNEGLGNSTESYGMQFELDKNHLRKDVGKENPAMRSDQAFVSSMDGNLGEFESNEKVLKQNKNRGSSNENGSLVSPNLQTNSQRERKSDDKKFETIENRNGNTDTMSDEVSRYSPNNGDKQFVAASGPLGNNNMVPENINFEKEELGVKKQFQNLGNSIESEKQNSGIGGRELESRNFENSVRPENRKNQVGYKKHRAGSANANFEKNEVGFEKESGNLRSNILTGEKNLVDDKTKFEKRFGNNIVENKNFGKDQRDFEKQSDQDSEGLGKVNPHTVSSTFQQEEPATGAEENQGNIAEDSTEKANYREENSRGYANSYYNIENDNPYQYQNSRAFLDKRNSIPKIDGFPNLSRPIKTNALDGLITDVTEPWMKNFLTKTLEMAVNGDNAIKTPTQDAAKYLENTPTTSLQSDSEENNLETASKEIMKSQKDNMPSDATKSSDEDHVSIQEEDNDDDNSTDNDDKDDDESSDVGAKTIEEGKSSPLPHLDKNNRENEDTSNNNIKDTPPPEQTEGASSEILKYAHESPIPASSQVVTQIVPVPPVASAPIAVPRPRLSLVVPEQGVASAPIAKIVPVPPVASAPIVVPGPRLSPVVPEQGVASAPIAKVVPAPNVVPVQAKTQQLPVELPNRPLVAVLQVSRAPGGKSSPSSEKTGPLVPDEESKEVNTNQNGIINELNTIIDNEIQNIGAFSKEKLESDYKEAQLSKMLKDAIPVDSRRPNDIDNDIKQEIEDLKDYAIALTETAGLPPAHHEDLARKLASDLLDEMKVADERKEELLKQLMAFVTSMEVATVRERLAEIRAQVLSFVTKQSDDSTKIRAEAVRLLDEFLDILPLPKVEIEEKKKRLLESKLLKSLVSEAERRSLRVKLKKALVHLVADNLL